MFAKYIQTMLAEQGVVLSGVADLSPVEKSVRNGMPYGILIAMSYTREALLQNLAGDMRQYYEEYRTLNTRLADATGQLVDTIQGLGYAAYTGTPTMEPDPANGFRTPLPHKTVATLSGVGWIGKCALLMTKTHGSAIRIATVTTDMPMEAGTPVDASSCPAGCRKCMDICPGKAIKGSLWERGMEREAYYDAFACREAAREREKTLLNLPKRSTICGLCIAACPITRAAYHY